MDVKTVFKTIFLTITLLGVVTLLTELYNASVNSALLRQKLDSAAESSLNYFNQESFRTDYKGGASSATVNLPSFMSSANPLNVYVSGEFYDHAGNAVWQASEMFNWYPGGTSGIGYDDSRAVEIWKIAMLNDSTNRTYSYSALVNGENLGFDYNCKKLPRVTSNLSPYNAVVPGTIEPFSALCSGQPKKYLGIVNRYTEDINETTRWNTYTNYNSYSRVTNTLDSYNMIGGAGYNDEYTTHGEFQLLYSLGSLNSLMHIKDAVDKGYTPANTGFPMFSWQLNRMFRWHLCSTFSGVGVNEDPTSGSYTSPAIDVDEDGNECIRWNGFNIYADAARITDINYYAYNLYDNSDLNAFCQRAGLDATTFVTNSKKYKIPGYDQLGFANTVVDESGNPFSFAMVVDIEYSVPVAYRGITPFRRVINWIQRDRKAGYAGFTSGNTDPTASGIAEYDYATTNMTGGVGDNAFMVDSSLQYVIMP